MCYEDLLPAAQLLRMLTNQTRIGFPNDVFPTQGLRSLEASTTMTTTRFTLDQSIHYPFLEVRQSSLSPEVESGFEELAPQPCNAKHNARQQ